MSAQGDWRRSTRSERWVATRRAIGWDKVALIMAGRHKPINREFTTNDRIIICRDRRPTDVPACLSHPTYAYRRDFFAGLGGGGGLEVADLLQFVR